MKKQWADFQKKYRLTLRELQVAKVVCTGCDNKEIAQKLGIAYRTVETHLQNIYRRVRINNRVKLLLKFLEMCEV